MTEPRRFLPPWFVEKTDACFIVRDHNGALAYVYFEARYHLTVMYGQLRLGWPGLSGQRCSKCLVRTHLRFSAAQAAKPVPSRQS